MKHSILTSPSKVFVVLSLCLLCFTGSICDPVNVAVDEGPCGESTTWDATMVTKDSRIAVYGFDGAGNRTITHIPTIKEPEDMCGDEHVKVQYTAVFSPSKPSTDIQVYGTATWSLFGRTKLLSGTTDRNHVEEIGLKQAFPSEPGYLLTSIQYVFPSQGGAELDSAWLAQRLVGSNIRIDYKKFKAK
jgi:hypothetical protein